MTGARQLDAARREYERTLHRLLRYLDEMRRNIVGSAISARDAMKSTWSDLETSLDEDESPSQARAKEELLELDRDGHLGESTALDDLAQTLEDSEKDIRKELRAIGDTQWETALTAVGRAR